MYSAPTLFSANAHVLASDLNSKIRDNLLALSPVGSYIYLHRSPDGARAENLVNGAWLECNGAYVDASRYPALFSLISNTYGPLGPFGTTFPLPDFSGRMIIGAAGAGGHADVTDLGDNCGTAAASRRPRHAHTFAESTHTHTTSAGTSSARTDGHQHSSQFPRVINDASDAAGSSSVWSGTTTHATTGPNGAHAHTFTAVLGGPSGPVTVDPGGNRPLDGPAYLVGGILCIKAVA